MYYTSCLQALQRYKVSKGVEKLANNNTQTDPHLQESTCNQDENKVFQNISTQYQNAKSTPTQTAIIVFKGTIKLCIQSLDSCRIKMKDRHAQ